MQLIFFVVSASIGRSAEQGSSNGTNLIDVNDSF